MFYAQTHAKQFSCPNPSAAKIIPMNSIRADGVIVCGCPRFSGACYLSTDQPTRSTTTSIQKFPPFVIPVIAELRKYSQTNMMRTRSVELPRCGGCDPVEGTRYDHAAVILVEGI